MVVVLLTEKWVLRNRPRKSLIPLRFPDEGPAVAKPVSAFEEAEPSLWKEFPMFAVFRHQILTLAATLLAAVGSSGAASAGWITIQNDTNKVVVIQESVTCNGQVRRCKPIRLLPGESVREFHSSPTIKVEVFDGQNRNMSLGTDNLTITSEKQTFAVGLDGRTVQVTPVPHR